MNKKEAAQVLAILKAAYPNHYKGMNAEDAQGTISVWTMQFSSISADIVLMALNKMISTSKYPPTIAEIKEKIVAIHWEAYENAYGSARDFDEEEIKFYKRVYKETEQYKYDNRIEPTLSEMLGGGNVKQLSEGAKQ